MAKDSGGRPAEAWTVSGTTVYLPYLDRSEGTEVVDELLSAYPPGALLLISNPTVAQALVMAGGRRGRHVYLMRNTLQDVPVDLLIDGLVLRPWEPNDARRLAVAYVSAYGEGHPDKRDPDLQLAEESLRHVATDAENPLMWVSQVAVLRGEPVGAAIVTLSEQMKGYSGPWLMNVFRSAHISTPGIGRAMIVRTMNLLREAGHDYYGLMVTTANPAFNKYRSLGFVVGLEGEMIVLPVAS